MPQAASAAAPFIYFEDVPSIGTITGVVKVTSTAGRNYSGAYVGDVRSDNVIVAYLRCNLIAARALRDALDKALLLANPTESDVKN